MNGTIFLNSIRNYIDTPWLLLGRNSLGLDCGGLVIVGLKDCKMVPESYDRRYDNSESYIGLHSTLDEIADEITDDSDMDGDIWTYKFTGDLQAHCAVRGASDNTIVHAYPVVQKVCEHPATGKWTRRVHKRYRLRFNG